METALKRQHTADTEIEETENDAHIERLKRKIELEKQSIKSSMVVIKRARRIAESASLM